MPTHDPTVDDVARALANRITRDIPVQDVIANFTVRPLNAAAWGHRGSGAPVMSIARAVHADLYGLRFDGEATPQSLPMLAHSAGYASTRDRRNAVLVQLVEQLPHLAEILNLAATWERQHAELPPDIAEWVTKAAGLADLLADDLTPVRQALTQETPPSAPKTKRPASPPATPRRPRPPRR
ncbi:hypothetical protein [Streptomyces sp. SID1121]|uniref:hypothetical protein n=1 Tax=Streptomyces sp. SID1121 TaxID=3425888 RepID=UPI004055B39B